MKTVFCLGLFVVILFSALQGQSLDLNGKVKLTPVTGAKFTWEQIKMNKASAVIFFSPECPICNALIKTVRDLADSFATAGVKFYLVYPGSYYSVANLRKFQKSYQLKPDGFRDDNNELVKLLGATVMPQVFVINPAGGIAYSGKIDNSYEGIGKRRTVITEFYLKDALNAVLQHREPKIKLTEPAGCFIN
jgi:peroxiredoxin